MSTCKNCNEPIQIVKGVRPREFCDNNGQCRNEWHRKNKKAKTQKCIPIEEYKELRDAKVKLDEILLKVVITDLNVPVATISPKPAPKTNFTVDSLPKEEEAINGAENAPERHRLFKSGDPKEGSMAFMSKYDCMNYEELAKKGY